MTPPNGIHTPKVVEQLRSSVYEQSRTLPDLVFATLRHLSDVCIDSLMSSDTIDNYVRSCGYETQGSRESRKTLGFVTTATAGLKMKCVWQSTKRIRYFPLCRHESQCSWQHRDGSPDLEYINIKYVNDTCGFYGCNARDGMCMVENRISSDTSFQRSRGGFLILLPAWHLKKRV